MIMNIEPNEKYVDALSKIDVNEKTSLEVESLTNSFTKMQILSTRKSLLKPN